MPLLVSPALLLALLLLFLLALAAPAAALDVTVTVLARHPHYVARVAVEDVPPGADVVTTAFVPLHLTRAAVTGLAPAGACAVHDRAPFGGTRREAREVVCGAAGGNTPTITFTVNGTAAYEPVRFPVAACRRPPNASEAPACQTNAKTWAALTPLDRVAACQVVGIFAFGFWVVTMCLMAACCLRMRTWHPYGDGYIYGDEHAEDEEGADVDDEEEEDPAVVAVKVAARYRDRVQRKPRRRRRRPRRSKAAAVTAAKAGGDGNADGGERDGETEEEDDEEEEEDPRRPLTAL